MLMEYDLKDLKTLIIVKEFDFIQIVSTTIQEVYMTCGKYTQ